MTRLLVCLIICTAMPVNAQRTGPSGVPIQGGDREFAESERDPSSAPDDSLARARALLAIARAKVHLGATSFWRRALPGVHLGGSVGLREIIFSEAPGVIALPRDSYRLSFSLSLNDLFDGSKHDLALLDVEEANLAYAQLLRKQASVRASLARKLSAKERDLIERREQITIVRALLDYDELLFRQGKTDYHTVARARLDLLRAEKELQLLQNESDMIKEMLR